MDLQTPPRPTGRQKITLAQLAAEAAKPLAVPATTPGRALAAFKRAAPAMGLPRRIVDLVDCLMSYTHAQDWDGGPGPGAIVWPSDVELEDRLQVGPSQRKVIVRAALDGGFIRMRRSPTGRRYGARDKPPAQGGRITYAYGFDLLPLAERMDELNRLAAEWEARRKEGAKLRREIACLRSEVLALVELAVERGYQGQDWPTHAAQAEALMHARGAQRDPLSLMPLVARLRALRVHIGEMVEAAAQHPEMLTVSCEETNPAGPEYRPLTTTTNQIPIVNTIASKLGHEERSRTEGAKPAEITASPRLSSPIHSDVTESALRGFVPTPDFILAVAPAFRDHLPGGRRGWEDLAQAAYDVRAALGVSPHAWGQAVLLLGRREATVALAVIAARHARGLVRSPGGLLRRMVELHESGTLRLDRTLFGLADELTRQRSAGTPLTGDGSPPA